MGTGRRVTFPLPEHLDEAGAEVRVERVAGLAASMRSAGVDEATIERIVGRAVEARDEAQLRVIDELVGRLAAGELRSGRAPATRSELVTFEDVARAWTSGKLTTKYPDHVRVKASAKADESRLDVHVLPVVGHVRIADFTLDHAMLVLASLPAELAPSTRRQIAILVKSVLRLAVFPLRLRPSSPLPDGWLPKVPKGSQKQQEILRPDEADRFLGAEHVPLEVRLVVGLLAREGMRRAELEALSWPDLDLVHGLVRLDQNKTDDPREWALRDDTKRALGRWHAMRGKPKNGLVFSVRLRNEHLREHLLDAGVDRAQLHNGTAATSPAGLHSLRSLFVTEALARGMTEAWVMERTGHGSSAMVNTYNRKAKAWRGASVPPLGDLEHALAWGETDRQADSKGIVDMNERELSMRNDWVGHEGLEPSANGLRVHCSTN